MIIYLSLWESSSVETRFLDIVCSYFLQLLAVQRSSIGDLRDLWPFQPMIRVMRNIQRNGCSNLSHFNLVKDAFILKTRFPSWSTLMFLLKIQIPVLLARNTLSDGFISALSLTAKCQILKHSVHIIAIEVWFNLILISNLKREVLSRYSCLLFSRYQCRRCHQYEY